MMKVPIFTIVVFIALLAWQRLEARSCAQADNEIVVNKLIVP